MDIDGNDLYGFCLSFPRVVVGFSARWAENRSKHYIYVASREFYLCKSL